MDSANHHRLRVLPDVLSNTELGLTAPLITHRRLQQNDRAAINGRAALISAECAAELPHTSDVSMPTERLKGHAAGQFVF